MPGRFHEPQAVAIAATLSAIAGRAFHHIRGAGPAARTLLADSGFDPVYGARPLRRAIERMVLNPLADEILGGKVQPGARVTADARDGAISFSA